MDIQVVQFHPRGCGENCTGPAIYVSSSSSIAINHYKPLLVHNQLGPNLRKTIYIPPTFPTPEIGVSKNSGTPKWMVYNGKPY